MNIQNIYELFQQNLELALYILWNLEKINEIFKRLLKHTKFQDIDYFLGGIWL